MLYIYIYGIVWCNLFYSIKKMKYTQLYTIISVSYGHLCTLSPPWPKNIKDSNSSTNLCDIYNFLPQHHLACFRGQLFKELSIHCKTHGQAFKNTENPALCKTGLLIPIWKLLLSTDTSELPIYCQRAVSF